MNGRNAKAALRRSKIRRMSPVGRKRHLDIIGRVAAKSARRTLRCKAAKVGGDASERVGLVGEKVRSGVKIRAQVGIWPVYYQFLGLPELFRVHEAP